LRYAPSGVDIAGARLNGAVGRIAIMADRTFNFYSAGVRDNARRDACCEKRCGKIRGAGRGGGSAFTCGSRRFTVTRFVVSRLADPPARSRVAGRDAQLCGLFDFAQFRGADRCAPWTRAQYHQQWWGTGRDRSARASERPLFPGYPERHDGPVPLRPREQVAFSNIELPMFNPYSGVYAGYSIAKGKLSTRFTYHIANRALQAEHHVIVDQLQWGQASANKARVSWPVRLATALLKDSHGVIRLDVPVRGTLDDPTFRLGPIIWKIIGNVITKAVTAPFRFLGSLFAGAEKAQFVDFAPGSAQLPDTAGEA
jgi:hypothetical protein